MQTEQGSDEGEALKADPNCILHIGKDKSCEKVKLFSVPLLEKCREKSLVYKFRENSEYANITIPEKVDSTTGYHSSCYKKFTAVSAKQVKEATDKQSALDEQCVSSADSSEKQQNSEANIVPNTLETPTTTRSLRSSSNGNQDVLNSRTRVFIERCIFCKQQRKQFNKKKESLILCKTENIQISILNDAKILEHQDILSQFAHVESNLEFVAKEVRYHPSCRNSFANLARAKKLNLEKEERSEWTVKKEIREKAFTAATEFVNDLILERGEVHRIKDLADHHRMLLAEYGLEPCDINPDRDCTFLAKLTDHFKGKIVILKIPTKGVGKIAFSSTIDPAVAFTTVFTVDMGTTHKVQEVAYSLRNLIFKAHRKPLPTKLRAKDIKRGEVNPPELLSLFFKCLLSGRNNSRKRKNLSQSKQIRIQALCDDSIFAVTNGLFKAKMHLELAIYLLSVTGKKEVLNVLNRLGKCVSYTVTQGLLTELAFTSDETSRWLPDGVFKRNDLNLMVGFDNFDLFVSTMTGKDTLHDTVGIVIQDIPVEEEQVLSETEYEEPDTDLQRRKRRRKTYVARDLDIAPYHKQPRMFTESMLQLDDPRRKIDTEIFHSANKIDFLWMTFLFSEIPETPMWVGFNSLIVENKHPIQRVSYLPQIEASPTRHDVVRETLERSLRLKEECDQKYISVTYDLAIAKVALCIQSMEAPTYDAIFIQLGPFHILMSFFKAVGKFISESGLPHILTESGVLAQGSLRGFLNGTNFNRNKRIHPMLAVALETLHFESFLKKEDTMEKSFLSALLLKIKLEPGDEIDFSRSLPSELHELFERYEKYRDTTLCGGHGATQQFCMIYVKLIGLYHDLSRAVRTGNHKLYFQVVPEIDKVFFAFNHQNYARWGTRFLDNLLKMEETHPGISELFAKGMLSVRRTKKRYSGNYHDLTLEQTVNLDAANLAQGVVNLTDSIPARQRWAINHYLRTEISSDLLGYLCLTSKEDVSREINPSCIKRDTRQLKDIIDCIMSCNNPFAEESNSLNNLSTGKAASSVTQYFLTNVLHIGGKAMDEFIKSCVADPANFEKPIKKQKISTFAEEGVNVKRRVNGKVLDIKMERDMFGRLLMLSLNNKIDMAIVFQYPLTPVPLVFGQTDGTVNHTSKSTLIKSIVGSNSFVEPRKIDAYVVDGFFFLHLFASHLPLIYEDIVRFLLVKLCNFKGSEIHLVFDHIISPSIKDLERDRRGNSERHTIYTTLGKKQKRPSNFLNALRSDSFKVEFVKLLVASFGDASLANILGSKKLYVTEGQSCFSFTTLNDEILRKEETEMACCHEEADTRMIAHAASIPSPATVVIRSADTDVFVIALTNIFKMDPRTKLYLEVGYASKNSLKFIDLSRIAQHLGPELARSLAGFHCFTGCDQIPSFAGKGKVTPLKILKSSTSYQMAFASLGSVENVSEESVVQIEKFTCEMYGIKRNTDKTKMAQVNDARYQIFCKKYDTPQKKKQNIQVKGIDGSNLPPCKSALYQQIARANCLSSVWNNAHSFKSVMFDPKKNGWQVKKHESDEKYFTLNWFEGEMLPKKLDDILLETSNDEEEQEEDLEEQIDNESDEEENAEEEAAEEDDLRADDD